MQPLIVARKIRISGVVQGVGFRPFLFQLAESYGFNGQVSNTSSGVTLLVEGDTLKMASFCRDISEKCPPLASVSAIHVEEVPIQGFQDFTIHRSSPARKTRSALIPPDVSICRDCLNEMKDPENRRFGYPFINCTNCGPRYTIIRDIPYDRPKTSMNRFRMCSACQAEYDNPMDRRFHAQPNACPECGPHAFLVDNKGRPAVMENVDAVSHAAKLMKAGAIVAVKGLGGFHLAADASNDSAVRLLRDRKKRPHKPFALMAASITDIIAYADVSPFETALMESYHRPIVLLRKKRQVPSGCREELSSQIAPGNHYLGVMLPYTPLHYLLMETGPKVLVMTSGNRSGRPLSIDNDDSLEAFSHIADYFLLHNRDIYFRADDSIMQGFDQNQHFIRRSRGYAPLPVSLDHSYPRVLACGAYLKNTVCLTKENRAFVSQHIGDLDNPETLAFFEQSITHLKRILDIEPEILAYDMHPGYLSTQWAMDQKGPASVAVQHHHAHAVACMVENHLDQEVIAITLDGTGYGTDGTVWGGEILICSRREFKRRAHLAAIAMPGGDAAVLEPWRMAVSWLNRAFGRTFLNLDIPFVSRHGLEKLEFITQMIDRSINSPLTSSCGRLFDAVAAMIGLRDEISFEGQAAIELESVAREIPDSGYAVRIETVLQEDSEVMLEINPVSAIRQIVTDVMQGEDPSNISGKFHQAMIKGFAEAAWQISCSTGIRDVVLSGGVFNNVVIKQGIFRELEKKGVRVYTHIQVPSGDGGISLGQAVVAGEKMRSKA